ncbi:MAG: type IV pilus modification protein PilV [Betaproteobacteria bacterium]|nr:type IV pilus modification protein PilV [Betaproteobacteria bacterium]
MRKTATRQRGMTLIESMVALAVAIVGILGIVGMQVRTLADTQTSVRRAQAVRLIEDLSERLRVNPSGLGNIQAYVSGFGNVPGGFGDCVGGECSNTALATYDVGVWKQAVGNMLPLGQAAIFLAPGENNVVTPNPNRRQLGVMVAWRENERDTGADYKTPIDVTLGDVTTACPADFTCHLQYIAVAGRCIPDQGSGTVQYYCAGG